MNIVLIGFGGSGKSSVARVIAAKSSRKLVDIDVEIEKSAGMKIPEIFESEGEAGFRRREADACRRAASLDNAVISCGGGAVLDRANTDCLRRSGRIFWLKAGPEEILRRVSSDPAARPILEVEGDKRDVIRKMLAVREPLYGEAADVSIVTDGLSVEQVAKKVVDGLKG